MIVAVNFSSSSARRWADMAKSAESGDTSAIETTCPKLFAQYDGDPQQIALALYDLAERVEEISKGG